MLSYAKRLKEARSPNSLDGKHQSNHNRAKTAERRIADCQFQLRNKENLFTCMEIFLL